MEKKFTNGVQNFRIEKNNKELWKTKYTSKCKKPQRSSFKIVTCEAFQRVKNETLQERGIKVNHYTDGRVIYNKYSPLTSVWYLSI